MDSVVLKPLCGGSGVLLRDIVHLEDTRLSKLQLPGSHPEMLLQYFHVIFLSSWCHLFCEVSPAAIHPHSIMLPLPYFTGRRLFSGFKHPPLSSKCNDGHYVQTLE
ncbi:hypothetical protein AMECASPLE_028939 [Ameca splendens]|uniref:Uncharacterized protein n=1 Tax=Ameca splendens TaxID=208324 RepID=A0ABV1A140_9TELE